MDIDEIYKELDKLYDNEAGAGVEDYLLDMIDEAVRMSDTGVLIQLMNEIIGYYREHSENQKGLAYCVRLQNIVENSEYNGTMAHATSLLNIATCLRSAGLLKDANAMYQRVKSYYDVLLPPESMLYASLYNNMSLLFREMGDYESACDSLERALGIALLYPDQRIEQATSYANLASTLVQLDRIDEAEDALTKSVALFEEDKDPDYHYSAALSALAEIRYNRGDYRAAAELYEKSLNHIERKVGKNKAYEITLSNLNAVRSKIPAINGLQLSQMFYEEYGKSMIHEKFPEYEDRIAVGLVGEGSECFGYDDEKSLDHDFGPGFCMWISDEDYEQIGERLQEEYDRLPTEYNGIRRIDSGKAAKRTGVFTISGFYRRYLGIPGAPTAMNEWLFLDDHRFATVTNGKIFVDKKGDFTRIRDAVLDYYPREARLRKIARSAALISQYGQYNYSRMLGRDDLVTAGVCLYNFMEQVMQMVYLLNKKYAPFYKWMRRGLEPLPILPEVKDDLMAISSLTVSDKKIPEIIDKICTDITRELVRQGLSLGGDNYLDNHVGEIITAITNTDREPVHQKITLEDRKRIAEERETKKGIADNMTEEASDPGNNEESADNAGSEQMGDVSNIISAGEVCMLGNKSDASDEEKEELIDKLNETGNKELVDRIVELEWEAFDKVKNEGGRASCQDDYETFSIMRKSQYYLWSEEMLINIIADFEDAKYRGWNMIAEKYGRMEESTAPDRYRLIEDSLPKVDDEKRAIVEAICSIQVGMMEEFAVSYPNAAGNARSIHTYEDGFNNTSYETYLRGELLTYSSNTLKLYGQFVVECANEGRNIAKMTMENTAKMYGYESIDVLESRLSE